MLAAVLVVIAPSAALGQTGLGVVKGTVSDATGAVIPGARVTLTHEDTNIIRESETSEVGSFEFPAVPLGRYIMSVEITGFKKYEASFLLEAGQTLELSPAMEIGSVDTVVEVSGAAPVITTSTVEISDVKDAMRIRQLPLNGRQITTLFALTPGVEGGGSPRVNGMKVGSVEMLLDGISLVDRFGGGMSRVQPGLDTVQEFRIETVGSSARNSRPATVQLVTKSGTNEIHGSSFWTHRNNAAGLRARSRTDGNDAAQLIRNEFGVSAGGPIIKNKTFWFAAYEGTRQRQARFAEAPVPTADMWSGDLSNLIDSDGVQTLFFDPSTSSAQGTRDLFPNQFIPQSRQNPFGKLMQAQTPAPTNGVHPLIGINFTANYPDKLDRNQWMGKIDHQLTSKDTLSGRLTFNKLTNDLLGGRFGTPPVGCTNCGGSGKTAAKVYNSMIRWNHTFSPTIFNELQFSNHRTPKSSGTQGNDEPWADNLGLPNPFGVTGWPTLCGADGFMFRRWGCWDGDNRKDENLTSYQIDENVTWIKGKHSMQFGAKLRQEYNNIRELQQAQGSHSFGGAWTAQFDPVDQQAEAFTGNGLGSILLGLPTALSNQANRGFFYFEQFELGLYFQDNIKVTPKLTLNLGVRYDRWAPYGEKFNRLTNVDLTRIDSQFQVITPGDSSIESLPGLLPAQIASYAARGLTWTTANAAGFPSSLIPADNNNLGPRLGAAYRVNDKTVIRASYGEYFWTMPLSQILQSSRTNPPLNLRFTNDVATQQGQDDFYALSRNPRSGDFIQNNSVPTDGIVTLSSRAQGMTAWDVNNWSDNRMRAWHFTVEREIMKETAVRLSYIGNNGRDLEQRFSVNQRETQFNYQARTGLQVPGNPDLRRVNQDWSLRGINHTGFSNSHSLQAEVERRYSDGLAFQWFYTFGRALSTTDAGGFTSGNGGINSTGGQNFRVPQNSELLGAPNLSYEERQRLGYINSGNVPAHRVTWNVIYDLPFARKAKGLYKHVAGGWQLATIGSWRSGMWQGVSGGRYLFGDPTLDASERLILTRGGRQQRLFFKGDFDPSSVSGVDQAALERLIPADRSQRVLRPLGASFNNRLPQQLADGSVRQTSVTDNVNWNSRNFFRGAGSWNVDLSLFKNFFVTEDISVRLTADAFNAFNAPMDVNPNSTTGLQDLSRQSNQPRIIQFSLRLNW